MRDGGARHLGDAPDVLSLFCAQIVSAGEAVLISPDIHGRGMEINYSGLLLSESLKEIAFWKVAQLCAFILLITAV